MEGSDEICLPEGPYSDCLDLLHKCQALEMPCAMELRMALFDVLQAMTRHNDQWAANYEHAKAGASYMRGQYAAQWLQHRERSQALYRVARCVNHACGLAEAPRRGMDDQSRSMILGLVYVFCAVFMDNIKRRGHPTTRTAPPEPDDDFVIPDDPPGEKIRMHSSPPAAPTPALAVRKPNPTNAPDERGVIHLDEFRRKSRHR